VSLSLQLAGVHGNDKSAPLLETARLRLRQFCADDLDASHALWNEPAVSRFMASGRASSIEDVWRDILQSIGLWQLLGYGYWVIEEKSSGRPIGHIGFGDFRRDMSPNMNDTPEAGWCLMTDCHGNGLGTEALAALCAWGDAHLPHAKTACIIEPENVVSIHLARKFGFREVAKTIYKGGPTLLLHRDRGFDRANPQD
jgi:RimJ/RimL family protein N-acetyltransferase